MCNNAEFNIYGPTGKCNSDRIAIETMTLNEM